MFCGPKLDALSVLVVDDNKFMRTVVENLCKGLGLGDFAQAEDVQQALIVLRDRPIDLVITDWHMEPTEGLTFVKYMRNDPQSPNPYVPIIMLTGHGDRDRVCEARDAGVNMFMAKPISAKAMYERLIWMINHPLPFIRTSYYFGPDRRRKQVRVVFVTGAGETFCYSADLTEAIEPLEQPEIDSDMRDEEGEFARWAIKDQFHAITQRAFRKLEGLPQAVIAAIDGAATGAGFEMTLACDLRIMTDRARLSEISVPADVVSEWSCSRNLPKLVGQTIANELILTGRSVGAAEARDIGLVNRVVAPESLIDEAMTLDGHIARMPGLGARHAKELIQLNNQDDRPTEHYKAELERVMEIIRGGDSAGGIRALVETRPTDQVE